MNTELIINAVNAVIEFNNQDIDYCSAGIQVTKFHIWVYAMQGVNWDYVFNVSDASENDLNLFIDKLQELSQWVSQH